jgi:uncharacterized membrane protein HdeD (DUF308 family)
MIAIIYFVAAPLLLICACVVRSAGDSHKLGSVAKHRWLGNRLLLLPIISLMCGLAAYSFPTFAEKASSIFTAAAFCVGLFMMAGSAKFRHGD